jgi:hypothetical protein
MTVRDHVVQLFDSTESRVESVATFLGSPCRNGQPILCVSRAAHQPAILDQMRRDGAPIDPAIAEGRATFLDAAETLRRISRHGTVDAARFDELIVREITRAARAGVVYVYGEMVDVLAERGDFADAVTLEALWNRLGARVPLIQLCGYDAAHFVAPETQRALLRIRAAHSSTSVQSQDPLAAWLLARE